MRKVFVTDKNSNTVTAQYITNSNDICDALDEIETKCSRDVIGLFNCPRMINEICDDSKLDTLIGTAKCDSTDEYDVYVGKDIAGAKLDMKYHTKMAKQYDRYIHLLEKAMSELYKLARAHRDKIRNIQADLDEFYR